MHAITQYLQKRVRGVGRPCGSRPSAAQATVPEPEVRDDATGQAAAQADGPRRSNRARNATLRFEPPSFDEADCFSR